MCIRDRFKGEREEDEAKRFAGMVMDWTLFLDELGFEEPPKLKGALRVAYQDACHLRHAQGVTEAPRRLLRSVSGVELVEPAEPDLCCGSAGSYNLDHPEVAQGLGRRKVKDLLATGADWIVSGNVGCLTQVRASMKKESTVGPRVTHLAGFMGGLTRGVCQRGENKLNNRFGGVPSDDAFHFLHIFFHGGE